MAQAKSASVNKVPEIRTGDTVVVLHGKDAGKRGKVEKVLRNLGSKHKAAGAWRGASSRPLAILISGVNIAKRHQKARPHMSQSTQTMAQQGGIVDKPMPIDVSNVMIGSGQSVRVCGHCREQLEADA